MKNILERFTYVRMPKKSKKGKNNRNNAVPVERKMVQKSDDEAYGLVIKKLGNGRFRVKINLGNEVIGRLCGTMRRGRNKRKNWVEEGSVVLVGLREFQDDKVDITHVFDPSEIRELKKSGAYIEETDVLVKTIDNQPEEEDCAFNFDDI